MISRSFSRSLILDGLLARTSKDKAINFPDYTSCGPQTYCVLFWCPISPESLKEFTQACKNGTLTEASLAIQVLWSQTEVCHSSHECLGHDLLDLLENVSNFEAIVFCHCHDAECCI